MGILWTDLRILEMPEERGRWKLWMLRREIGVEVLSITF